MFDVDVFKFKAIAKKLHATAPFSDNQPLCLPFIIFRIDSDVIVVLVPFMGDLMLVRRQGVDEDFIGLRALIDTFVGDVDFIAIFMGIDAAGMVTAFSTSSDDKGNAGLTGFGIQPVQESDGRTLEVGRIGRPVAIPRRIHAFSAAPLAQVALAEIAAVCIGIGNGRIV